MAAKEQKLPPEISKRNQKRENGHMVEKKKKPVAQSKPSPVQNNKWLNDLENSPMDSHEEEGRITMNKEDISDAVQVLMDEHEAVLQVVVEFEQAIESYKIKQYNLTDEINASFSKFFKCFDEELLPHNRKEEKTLFPILNKRLLMAGEHSKGKKQLTAIDVMEDDHVKFIQLGALSFNLLGLATRIVDENSRLFILNAAYETSRELIDLIRLHVFREDETLFPIAQKYLSEDELKRVYEEMEHL